jgi:hypothetical protein
MTMEDKFEKGEMVLIDYSRYGILNFGKGVIIEITKAGNYKVQADGKENYEIFNSSRRLRGGGDWDTTYIRKFSESSWNKYVEQKEKRTIISNIKSMDFRNLDLETLRKIQEIINDK